MTELRETLRGQAAAELRQLGADLRVGKEGAGAVGRILRAHLVVELCLRRHLQAMNPNLGPIEDLRLNFDKLRIAVTGMKAGSVAWANEELQCLNKLRNTLAHHPDKTVSCEDVKVLRSDAEALLKDSVAKERLGAIVQDPAWIVEAWAMVFGTMLAVERAMQHHADDPEARQRELNDSAIQLLRELIGENGQHGGV